MMMMMMMMVGTQGKAAPHFHCFVFQVCFDHKPRIISQTNKDEPSLCSYPVTKHDFELHK